MHKLIFFIIGELYRSMNISYADNKSWYGYASKLKNMLRENFKKAN